MPKRGQHRPYRVVYTYPPSERAPKGIPKTTIVHDFEDVARRDAEDIAGRGGTAQVVHVAQDGTRTVLHTYKPDLTPED